MTVARCISDIQPIPDPILAKTHRGFFRRCRRASAFLIDGNPFSEAQFQLIRDACVEAIGENVVMSAVLFRLNIDLVEQRLVRRSEFRDTLELSLARLSQYEQLHKPMIDQLISNGFFAAVISITSEGDHETRVAKWIDDLCASRVIPSVWSLPGEARGA